MKKLLLILLIIPLVSFSETKYEIAREILNTSKEFRESLNILETNVKEQRQYAIEAYAGDMGIEGLPQDVIALKEQLRIDIISSDLFKIDKTEFEAALINQYTNVLSYEELIELRELHMTPLFKKLVKIDSQIITATNSFMSIWEKHNTKLGDNFSKRAKEINDMAIEYFKLQQESTP